MSASTENSPAPVPALDARQQVLQRAFELNNSGRHADAQALCEVLLPLLPQDAQLLFLLGNILQKLGRSPEALVHLERAAQLQPTSARILNSLGFVHQSLKNHARAVDYYDQAIRLGLVSADTYYSLGNACYQLGEVERAASLFQKAVELQPRDVASWRNLGKCLYESNRLKESIQAYDQALLMDPHSDPARFGRALSLLAAGRLTEGFGEYNQSRLHDLQSHPPAQPRWHGEPIPGRTLLLHAEQGFGDEIQYVRFLPQLRERVAQLILQCRPELKTLFTRCVGADMVIAHGEPLPPFDYVSSLPSLPGILGVTLATIPNQVPYLKLPATAGQLPSAPGDPLKVGIVWAGNPTHHNDAARSIPLEEFAPILIPGIAFYSLQAAVPLRDETYFRSLPNLLDLPGRLGSFLETAAIIMELDLVIAVDTAVAHLAGALGKPVWTLLPLVPDWRWLLDREDTPWYPTMRLFRQKNRGQWQPVIARVAAELRQAAHQNRP